MRPPRSLTAIYPNVTQCHDAKRPVEIEIKARDVNTATKKDATACAMANAICREWKADEAVIGLSYSYVIKGNTAMRFLTPLSVQREIVSFDRSKDFRPGKYHLAAIPKSQRRKASGKRKPRKSHQPKRVTFHRETLGIRKMREGTHDPRSARPHALGAARRRHGARARRAQARPTPRARALGLGLRPVRGHRQARSERRSRAAAERTKKRSPRR